MQALYIGHTYIDVTFLTDRMPTGDDKNVASDVFHGAYIYSYLTNPPKSWEEHFRFARAAAAFKIQHLGNEAGLPAFAKIAAVRREFEVPS